MSLRNRGILQSTPELPAMRAMPCRMKHRKRLEEAFRWAKIVGGMAQNMYRGVARHPIPLHPDYGRQQPRQTAPVAGRVTRKNDPRR